MNESRNNPYFTPYGYKDAIKILNGTAPQYYYHLKEIEMDSGDGSKLANYAKKRGLNVIQDPDSDPDYPTWYIPREYHWDDYFYPYPYGHESKVEEKLIQSASDKALQEGAKKLTLIELANKLNKIPKGNSKVSILVVPGVNKNRQLLYIQANSKFDKSGGVKYLTNQEVTDLLSEFCSKAEPIIEQYFVIEYKQIVRYVDGFDFTMMYDLDDVVKEELIQSSSDKSLQQNIKTEIDSGKSPKQAAAIAYSIQRKNESMKSDLEENLIDKNDAVCQLVHSEYAYLHKDIFEKAGLKTVSIDDWFYVIGDKDIIENIYSEQDFFEPPTFLSDSGVKELTKKLASVQRKNESMDDKQELLKSMAYEDVEYDQVFDRDDFSVFRDMMADQGYDITEQDLEDYYGYVKEAQTELNYKDASEDELRKMGAFDNLHENTITSTLSPVLDKFLMDMAQMYCDISYDDIMKFAERATKKDLAELTALRKDLGSEFEEDDPEVQEIFRAIENLVKYSLHEAVETKICVICNHEYDGYGNNAEPVAKGYCCDKCNMEKVIPARLGQAMGLKESDEAADLETLCGKYELACDYLSEDDLDTFGIEPINTYAAADYYCVDTGDGQQVVIAISSLGKVTIEEDTDYLNFIEGEEYSSVSAFIQAYLEKIGRTFNESLDSARARAQELRKHSDADVVFYAYKTDDGRVIELEPEELSLEQYRNRVEFIVNQFNEYSDKNPRGNRYAKESDFGFYALYKNAVVEGLFDKKKIGVFNRHSGEGPKHAVLDSKKEDEFTRKIKYLDPENWEVCEYTEKNGKAIKGKPVDKYNKIMIDYQADIKKQLDDINAKKAQQAKDAEEQRKQELKKQPHWTRDPRTGAKIYRDLVDAEDIADAQYNEDLQEIEMISEAADPEIEAKKKELKLAKLDTKISKQQLKQTKAQAATDKTNLKTAKATADADKHISKAEADKFEYDAKVMNNVAQTSSEADVKIAKDKSKIAKSETDQLKQKLNQQKINNKIQQQQQQQVQESMLTEELDDVDEGIDITESVLAGAVLTGLGTSIGAGIIQAVQRLFTSDPSKKKSKWKDYKGYIIEITPENEIHIYDSQSKEVGKGIAFHTMKQAQQFIKDLKNGKVTNEEPFPEFETNDKDAGKEATKLDEFLGGIFNKKNKDSFQALIILKDGSHKAIDGQDRAPLVSICKRYVELGHAVDACVIDQNRDISVWNSNEGWKENPGDKPFGAVNNKQETSTPTLDLTGANGTRTVEVCATAIYNALGKKYSVEVVDGFKIHVIGSTEDMSADLSRNSWIVQNRLTVDSEKMSDGSYSYKLKQRLGTKLREGIEEVAEDKSKPLFSKFANDIERLANETGLNIYLSEPESDGDTVELWCTEVFDIEGTGLIDVCELLDDGTGYDYDLESIIDYLINIGLYELEENLIEMEEGMKGQYTVTGVTNNGNRVYYNADTMEWFDTAEEATIFTDHDIALDTWSVITKNGRKLPDGFRRIFVPNYVKEALDANKWNIGSNKLDINVEERMKLEQLAQMLEDNSPNEYIYKVERTYEDFGAGMEWWTIICYDRYSKDRWQVLNTKEWLDLMNGASIETVYEEVVNGQYFQDKEKSLDDMNMRQLFDAMDD